VRTKRSEPYSPRMRLSAPGTLRRARRSYADGDFRWVAQVVNHVVFADPHNAGARALQADILEQLGYGSENGTWRNFYLMGALELRHGSGRHPHRRRLARHARGVDLGPRRSGRIQGPRSRPRN
jgi:alkyl sulfatase BDS1-like metallo-beta-lactamase superfamily hydrolase